MQDAMKVAKSGVSEDGERRMLYVIGLAEKLGPKTYHSLFDIAERSDFSDEAIRLVDHMAISLAKNPKNEDCNKIIEVCKTSRLSEKALFIAEDYLAWENTGVIQGHILPKSGLDGLEGPDELEYYKIKDKKLFLESLKNVK